MNTNNTPQNTGFTTRIMAAMERLFLRRVHQPDKPYVPQPDQNQGDFIASLGTDAEYSEMEANINQLFGSSLIFGTQKIVQIDENGKARDISRGQSYRIGSNKIVSKIEDIAGVCPICEVAAAAAYKAGKISLQQAQLNSMYDKDSAARCSLCGRNICTAHCHPVQIDETIQQVCDTCLKQVESKKLRQKVVNFLLAPFTEPKGENE